MKHLLYKATGFLFYLPCNSPAWLVFATRLRYRFEPKKWHTIEFFWDDEPDHYYAWDENYTAAVQRAGELMREFPDLCNLANLSIVRDPDYSRWNLTWFGQWHNAPWTPF